jgi:hypothetical protein
MGWDKGVKGSRAFEGPSLMHLREWVVFFAHCTGYSLVEAAMVMGMLYASAPRCAR